jgi:hypothetical protein
MLQKYIYFFHMCVQNKTSETVCALRKERAGRDNPTGPACVQRSKGGADLPRVRANGAEQGAVFEWGTATDGVSYICCKCFIWILQVFDLDVVSVSYACCKCFRCFICMLLVFHMDVTGVFI